VDSGRGVEVDTTSFPLPPFFPPVPVETGRGVGATTGLTLLVETTVDEVFGSFPPFPTLSVGDGTAGEVEERTSERVAVGLTTEVDEMSLEAGGIAEVDEMSLDAGGIAEVDEMAGGIAEDEVPLTAVPSTVTVNWRRTTCQ